MSRPRYKTHTLLTADEEKDLIQKAQQGDIRARNRVMEQNMRLVYKHSIRLAGSDPDLEQDLISEGALAIAHAITKMDLARGVRFSTYATFWIRQRMLRYLQNNRGCMRIPVHVQDSARDVLSTLEEMQAQGVDLTNVSELCNRTDLPEEKINTLLSIVLPSISLDEKSFDGDGDAFSDSLGDRIPAPLDEYDLGNPVIEEMLKVLPERHRQLISDRIGYPHGYHRTLQELGDKSGCSRERIRQLEDRAILRLQKYVEFHAITEEEILTGELVA